MTFEQWIILQEQLWSVYGPLLTWWLAFVMAGMIGAISVLFGGIYFSDWLNGNGRIR